MQWLSAKWTITKIESKTKIPPADSKPIYLFFGACLQNSLCAIVSVTAFQSNLVKESLIDAIGYMTSGVRNIFLFSTPSCKCELDYLRSLFHTSFSKLGILPCSLGCFYQLHSLLHSITSAAVVKLPREVKAVLPNTTNVSKGVYCGCLI